MPHTAGLPCLFGLSTSQRFRHRCEICRGSRWNWRRGKPAWVRRTATGCQLLKRIPPSWVHRPCLKRTVVTSDLSATLATSVLSATLVTSVLSATLVMSVLSATLVTSVLSATLVTSVLSATLVTSVLSATLVMSDRAAQTRGPRCWGIEEQKCGINIPALRPNRAPAGEPNCHPNNL